MEKSSAITALGALAQETRLDIFRLLIGKAPQGVPAGEIGERLGLPPPTLSFHLNQLRFAGLVSSRRQSRSIIYFANLAAMNGLLAYLTDNCCGGRPELCAPEPCAVAANGNAPAKRMKPRGRHTRRAKKGAVIDG
jgi:ArsR family transcriptional regulator, arsenate/arsenite/antimonite-responsive transcriptional repressor